MASEMKQTMCNIRYHLVMLVFLIKSTQSANSQVCSSAFEIVSDLNREDCDAAKNYYYFPYDKKGDYDCFPQCLETIAKESVKCTANTLPCRPGYKCGTSGTTTKCIVDESSCLKYYNAYTDANNKWIDSYMKPECELDGTYKAKQCKGDRENGRCFCYDKVGNRIFGTEWSNKAEDMTCACSRKKLEILEDPTRLHITLHCDRNGNYEELQCDSGLCWCVEPKTGDLVSKVVTEAHLSVLPCYKEAIIGEYYLRICESHQYGNNVVRNKFKIHGTTDVNLGNVECDWDGAYAPIQVSTTSIRCMWRDYTETGYQAGPQDGALVNCNCAWDSKYYTESGKTLPTICDSNGNYRFYQMTDKGTFYCVDQDGFQKHADNYIDPPSEENCNKLVSF